MRLTIKMRTFISISGYIFLNIIYNINKSQEELTHNNINIINHRYLLEYKYKSQASLHLPLKILSSTGLRLSKSRFKPSPQKIEEKKGRSKKGFMLFAEENLVIAYSNNMLFFMDGRKICLIFFLWFFSFYGLRKTHTHTHTDQNKVL